MGLQFPLTKSRQKRASSCLLEGYEYELIGAPVCTEFAGQLVGSSLNDGGPRRLVDYFLTFSAGLALKTQPASHGGLNRSTDPVTMASSRQAIGHHAHRVEEDPAGAQPGVESVDIGPMRTDTAPR